MSTRLISFRISLLFLLTLVLAACGGAQQTVDKPATTPTVAATPAVDDRGTPIVYPKTAPQRIISLTANTSEMLGALGLQDKVVAVDNYTTYPKELTSKPRISDAMGKYNIEQITALKPDLVLSHGGITHEVDDKLRGLGLNVVDLPAVDFTKSLEQILIVGKLTHTEQKAQEVYEQATKERQDIIQKVAGTEKPKVLLEVDNSTAGKPFVFGKGSFGDEMLRDANAINIFAENNSNGGYPQVTDEAIIRANPAYIILTEDPKYGGDPSLVYKRPNWGGIQAVKEKQVYHVNVNITQHAGPRLVQGLRCIAQIVHPDKFTEKLPQYCSDTI
uniref:Putative ABC transporter substrate-binding lipoprotein YvrC n=1 Tax=Thermosporothrix sp. COM3 TaxID=2490863 RepID=A0A455SIF8_9CHLR|nr:putative ABC transporter substrate-binding lipoprotein YvrC [Thermosporothrix sp. COM3]